MKKKKRLLSPYSRGYNKGYTAGHAAGKERARTERARGQGMPFDGVSIIIPTYNQSKYLQECINSISQYTPEAHEIIVVDNASQDDTATFLSNSKHIRSHINEQNKGFAGAVNQGLAMARGSFLLILNNDSVVTTGWLNGLMYCLQSNRKHGIVGPVTNYISGDQQIAVTYSNPEQMQQFAKEYNSKPSPENWQNVGRLTGFCMLMRREDFERIGYFDEGFEIGNCEDDDYGLRARMLGLQLMIARDTFIHHYGSVSMRSLKDQFDSVYEHNLAYYAAKWSDPLGMISLEWQQNRLDGLLSTIDLYPTCIITRGSRDELYWIEQRSKRLITGTARPAAVRLSDVDMQAWLSGPPINEEELMHRLNELQHPPVDSSMQEGRLYEHAGKVYQVKGGRLHPYLNDRALGLWHHLHWHKTHLSNIPELYAQTGGCPLIAPPIIQNPSL